MTEKKDLTKLLKDAQSGDESALNALFPLVYDELRRLAALRMKDERVDHTLQPTALVHEVYMRLIDQHSVDWSNRVHFFGLASEMMRRILVTHAVAKKTSKRGGGLVHLELNEAISFAGENEIDFVALDEALGELEKFAPRQAKVVEMRFFGGLTNEEVAAALAFDERTIKRDWRAAKAWLYDRLKS
ncbi:MAG: sigma-70 family RNA polymerase sigma factor [Acidobacteria bacterium]|nr:sigma-70 family RNA polymerase sigma factor [Acidobacteriota bacterium]